MRGHVSLKGRKNDVDNNNNKKHRNWKCNKTFLFRSEGESKTFRFVWSVAGRLILASA